MRQYAYPHKLEEELYPYFTCEKVYEIFPSGKCDFLVVDDTDTGWAMYADKDSTSWVMCDENGEEL